MQQYIVYNYVTIAYILNNCIDLLLFIDPQTGEPSIYYLVSLTEMLTVSVPHFDSAIFI